MADTVNKRFNNIKLDSAGLTIGASVPFSDSTGTLTLQNVDAIDATTEATIEAAVDTLTNLASTTTKGTTGGLTRTRYEATANITAAASVTITLSIPATSRIVGCQLRVDSALAAGELWDAAYETGSSAAICSAQAVAANTKVNSMTTDVTTDTTNIAITKNGGGAFTAQGTIRAIVYADTFETMADA